MSERQAKALRREIRRAVGPEAVGVIESHTRALDHWVAPTITEAQARIMALEDRIALLETRFASICDGLKTVGR